MKHRKSTAKTGTTQNLDPAEIAKQELLARQRFLSTRKLLRRRRRKSHQ